MKDTTLFRAVQEKTRVFIVSDISNEPDDAESLVRYLLYSNEFDTRGLVACTSNWMKRVVHPEDMLKIIEAYGKVVDNLNKNVHPDNQYSPAEYFASIVKTGPALYGKEALQPGVPMSDGAKLLIDRLDESDKPLWILCWGGTNVLAQALQHVRQTRSEDESHLLRSKMRVYAISDQDDTGAWIRREFPDIFYIASVHGWNQYGLAAWTGISGDKFYGFDKGGPNFEKISKEWIAENIQIGPLGKAYPEYFFIPEGDTPTFLYLIQNGLGSPEHPDWGSWGGRYLRSDAGPDGGRHYSDAVDHVVGQEGQTHVSNQATIWRWRDKFQDSFAARMQWTLSDDNSKTNHAPVVVVNGDSSIGALWIEAEAGTGIELDATGTYDPDGDQLTYRWFQYKDVTATQWWVDAEVQDVVFKDQNAEKPGLRVKVQLPPPEKCAVDILTGVAQEKGQALHLILEVTDNGRPPLTTYKRVIVQVTNKDLRGGRQTAAESVMEAHGAL
ncbi:hypothetical protein HII31_01323 [Pseudocercospora fuligena]|uniref:Cellulose-binding protein n=1 Tax=Pseudocercospora fuligena TaxID=685502 RepID=A0A8H6RV77_9PEZI|nr:hypothetical protein HII31_01323 [Pseudocercospora fuligena]